MKVNFKVLKRELNIISQNKILKCECRLKNAPITNDAKSQSLLSQINNVGY